MSKTVCTKKGLDINLLGKAEKLVKFTSSKYYTIKPTDFPGLTPKVALKPGSKVKAGSVLFYDKYNPEIKFTSPVSGELSSIHRGKQRRILEFVIEADNDNIYESYIKGEPNNLSREEIKENILKSGCWSFIRQRPFAIIANPTELPRDIFVSAYDSAPLAPDFDFIVKEELRTFQTGINALSKLTNGKVYLGIKSESSVGLNNISNAEIIKLSGPHPVGNAGVIINKTKPINKGEIVWTLNAADVLIIGRLFEKGIFDASRTIALTGSEVSNPQYYKTLIGTGIEAIVKDNIKKSDDDLRYISGNILTGEQVSLKNYLGFYDNQITVIPEGNKSELLAWGAPGFGKFSVSRTFFSWLNPKKELRVNTKLNGGERPFIVTGEMERVFPMDIYPMQLLKAIHIRDLDLMEELGIYEIAEEDFALCEVISTSKIEIQKMIRDGFEFMIKELG